MLTYINSFPSTCAELVQKVHYLHAPSRLTAMSIYTYALRYERVCIPVAMQFHSLKNIHISDNKRRSYTIITSLLFSVILPSQLSNCSFSCSPVTSLSSCVLKVRSSDKCLLPKLFPTVSAAVGPSIKDLLPTDVLVALFLTCRSFSTRTSLTKVVSCSGEAKSGLCHTGGRSTCNPGVITFIKTLQ